MEIIRPEIFSDFGNVIAAVSTKKSDNQKNKYGFNLSLKVGDDENLVLENRNSFANQIGINFNDVAHLDQIHSNYITIANKGGNCGNFDAIITNKENVFVAVTIADCVPILLFAPDKKICAAIHAGWRGSVSKITTETLKVMKLNFNVDVRKIKAFIGPSASKCCYNVNAETAEKFSSENVEFINQTYYVDLKKSNMNELLDFGVSKNNILISDYCTICNENFQSFRRDKNNSGRMMALIGVKK